MAITTTNMGLTSWNSIGDLFSHTDLANNWAAIDNHDHSTSKGLPIQTAGLANLAVTQAKIASGAVSATQIANATITATQIANSAVNTSQLATSAVTADKLADAARLGLSGSTVVRRGSVNIPAVQTTASATFTLLATPDRVSGIVLPTDGLIIIGYQALWKVSATGPASCAIFVGANQLKQPLIGGPPNLGAAQGGTTSAFLSPLATYNGGLTNNNGVTADASEVTTGELIGTAAADGSAPTGGFCLVFAAAGTYDITVQYKTVAGTITVQNRHLWVSTTSF